MKEKNLRRLNLRGWIMIISLFISVICFAVMIVSFIIGNISGMALLSPVTGVFIAIFLCAAPMRNVDSASCIYRKDS